MPKLAILLAAAFLAACSLQPTDYNGTGAPSEAAIVPLRSDRPVVALALGSGGARGFAHVGVIKALEEGGIEADIVTGASSGAVVAALYASGSRSRWNRATSWTWWRSARAGSRARRCRSS
jgi:NTE family protein